MAKIAAVTAQATYRYVRDIHLLTDSQLESHGYYKGFPCPHGHTIRDSRHHWCYHCAKKIQSNICGFDLNYLHSEYKQKYYRLWKKVEVGHPDECWRIKTKDDAKPGRVCIPSYRTLYSNQKSENVTFHKAIYMCAWGDIGSMVVTRLCGNPYCGNPLHLISTWNRLHTPQDMHPFETDFVPEKLMCFIQAERLSRQNEIIERSYKRTISHPVSAKDAPYYDEGG